MSLGRQVLREIFEEIETQFFKNLETDQELDELGNYSFDDQMQRIKRVYQQAATKALADYLEKVYIQ